MKLYEMKYGILLAMDSLLDPFYRIKNIISWIPFLWRDQDYDFVYCLNAFEKKLFRLANYIEKKKRHEGWEEQVKEIREVLSLFDKFKEGSKYITKPDNIKSTVYDSFEEYIADENFMKWSRDIQDFETKSWETAWNLVREKGNNWWD